MRLLKRTTPPLYDEHMTYFTVSQAEELRRLVARSFAAVGRDVDVYPDRIEDRGGATLGLLNIGALCARAGADEWPQLIDEHVRLVATPARELADVTEAEVEGYGPVPHQVDGDYLGDVEHLVLRHEPEVIRLVIPR